jgi:hypothetical protein
MIWQLTVEISEYLHSIGKSNFEKLKDFIVEQSGVYDEEVTPDTLYTDEESGIFDGDAAMTAYARTQFTHMSQEEFDWIRNALLRYCKLDTMAIMM